MRFSAKSKIFDRLTHIQHKHLRAACHRSGFQHQLRCLRDGHKK